jgi:RNA polymerase sigma-70 factor (ECF subfamily)
VPDNPTGWIYNVAKFKAFNILKRVNVEQKYSSLLFENQSTLNEVTIDQLFSEKEIEDDQLRMMFTCCHPDISSDSQIALILKTLCGFSIPEISKAFLTNEENINKRLVRARKTIRENKIDFEVPSQNEIANRLNTILETIYLIFNEGYNATTGNEIIRQDLCGEAIRLAHLISENTKIQNKSEVWSLLALMLLNASRFKSRQSEANGIVDLANQNRELWNRELISKGIQYLDRSIETDNISKYQILATISAHHCTAPNANATDWKSILILYELLQQIEDSPLIVLNKSIAMAKVHGAQKAVDELDLLKNDSSLIDYPYYYSTLAELYLVLEKPEKTISHLERAIILSQNEQEKKYLKAKLNACLSVS